MKLSLVFPYLNKYFCFLIFFYRDYDILVDKINNKENLLNDGADNEVFFC